jgi:glycosyltransferase involved in cell wall biosynthesis
MDRNVKFMSNQSFTKTSKAPRVLIAHLGARRHYQEPILLYQWGMLDTFYTDFYARDNIINRILRSPRIYRFLPLIIKKMLDRYTPELDGAKVIDFPCLGIGYVKSLEKASVEDVYDIFISVGKKFNEKILARGLEGINTIYGFNNASLELFEAAKLQGIRCILDQTIAVSSLEYRLMTEEEKNWKDWSISPFRVTESMLHKARREKKEQELADHVICGSDFVRSSLVADGIAEHKISVISLGKIKEETSGELELFVSQNIKNINTSGDSLKILFMGSVGLRKGIPYLLEALRIIENKIPFICKIAGTIGIKQDKINEYQNLCQFLGQVPRTETTQLYQWADVFVLPSLCEGSAMVTYEALMFGLPIITTHNAGSIIRDGVDGFIVPIRDSQAIAKSLVKIFQNFPRDYSSKLSRVKSGINYIQANNQQEKLKKILLMKSEI